MAGSYKVVVKNGNYKYNSQTLNYDQVDDVIETKDAVEALREFLDSVEGESSEDGNKVTLTFQYSKDKKKKKK